MADWSMLPNDLLGAIALKLDSINDLTYFSAVCRSWNNVFMEIKRKWMGGTPWLLLAEDEDEHEQEQRQGFNCGRRKIFDISKNKCLELSIPQGCRRRCWGSKYGLIVMIDNDDKQRIWLYNPITKAEIMLPSLVSLPDDEFGENRGIPNYRVRKAILIRIDDKYENEFDVHNFAVIVIYRRRSLRYFDHQISLARPGDKTWRKVITRNSHYVDEFPPYILDVLCWKGSGSGLGLMLVLQAQRFITYCDVTTIGNSSSEQPIYANKPFHTHPFTIDVKLNKFTQERYMVQVAGDLLLVFRNRFDEDFPFFRTHHTTCYYARDFKVYKFEDSENIWSPVKNLGDYMIFVANNSTMSVHKSKLPNCQHNAIYFTDDDSTEAWDFKNFSPITLGKDMGMFDMTSTQIKPFYQGNVTMSKVSAPIWFMPKF